MSLAGGHGRGVAYVCRVMAVLYLCLYGHVDGLRHRVGARRPLDTLRKLEQLESSTQNLHSAFEAFDVEDDDELGQDVHLSEGPPLSQEVLLQLEDNDEDTGTRGAEVFVELQTFREYVYNNVLSEDKFPQYTRPEGEETGAVNAVKHWFGERIFGKVKEQLFNKDGYIQKHVESGIEFIVDHAVKVKEPPMSGGCEGDSTGLAVDLRGFAAIPKLDVNVREGKARSIMFQQEEIVVEEVKDGREHVDGTRDDKPVDNGEECGCLRFPVAEAATDEDIEAMKEQKADRENKENEKAKPEPSMLSRFFRSAYKPNSMAFVKDCAVSDDFSTFDPTIGTGLCRTTHSTDPSNPSAPFHVVIWSNIKEMDACPAAQRMHESWMKTADVSKGVVEHACRLAVVRYSGLSNPAASDVGDGGLDSPSMTCANSGAAETMESIKEDDFLKAFKVSMPQEGTTGKLVNWVWGSSYVSSINGKVKDFVKSSNLMSDSTKDSIPMRCFNEEGEWQGKDTDDAMMWITHEKEAIKCYKDWKNSHKATTDSFLETGEGSAKPSALFTGSDGPMYTAARMTRDKLKAIIPALAAPLVSNMGLGGKEGADADQILSHAALIARSPLSKPGSKDVRRHLGAVAKVEDAFSGHVARAMLTGQHGLGSVSEIINHFHEAHRSRQLSKRDSRMEPSRPHAGTSHEALVDAFVELAEESMEHARSLTTTRGITSLFRRVYRAIVAFLYNYYDIIIAVAAFCGFTYGALWLSHSYVTSMNGEVVNQMRDVNVFRGEESVGTWAKRWVGWSSAPAEQVQMVSGLNPLQSSSLMSMVPTSTSAAMGAFKGLLETGQAVFYGSMTGSQSAMVQAVQNVAGAESNLWWFQKMGPEGLSKLSDMESQIRGLSMWYNKLNLVFSLGMIISGAYIIYWLIKRVIWMVRQVYLWMTRQVEDDVCTPTFKSSLFHRAADRSVLSRDLHSETSWLVKNVLGRWSYRWFSLPDDDGSGTGSLKAETKDDLSKAKIALCTFVESEYHCYDVEDYNGRTETYDVKPERKPNQISRAEKCGNGENKCVIVSWVHRGRPDASQETVHRVSDTPAPTHLLVMSDDAWSEYLDSGDVQRLPIKCYSDSHGNKYEDGKCRWPIIPLTPDHYRTTHTFTNMKHEDGSSFEYPLPSDTGPMVPNLDKSTHDSTPSPSPPEEASSPGHIKKEVPFFCAGQDVEFVFRPFFYWYRSKAERMFYPNYLYVIDPDLAEFHGTPDWQRNAEDVDEMMANAYVRREFPDGISKVRDTENIWNLKNKLMDVSLSGNANDRSQAIYPQWTHRITCGKMGADGNLETMKIGDRDTSSTDVLCRIVIPYGDLLNGYRAASENKCTTGGVSEEELEKETEEGSGDPDLEHLDVGGDGGRDFEKCGSEFTHMPPEGRLLYVSLGYTSIHDISFGAILPIKVGVSPDKEQVCEKFKPIALEYDELAMATSVGGDMCEGAPLVDETFPSLSMDNRSDLCWGYVKSLILEEDSTMAPNFYKNCGRAMSGDCADNMMTRLRQDANGTPWTHVCENAMSKVRQHGDPGSIKRADVRESLVMAVKAEGAAGGHCEDEWAKARAALHADKNTSQ